MRVAFCITQCTTTRTPRQHNINTFEMRLNARALAYAADGAPPHAHQRTAKWIRRGARARERRSSALTPRRGLARKCLLGKGRHRHRRSNRRCRRGPECRTHARIVRAREPKQNLFNASKGGRGEEEEDVVVVVSLCSPDTTHTDRITRDSRTKPARQQQQQRV